MANSAQARKRARQSEITRKRNADASEAFPPIQGFFARRIFLAVRAYTVDKGALQALRALSTAARPNACDGVREGVDAHARVVRGGDESAGRDRDQSESRRHAAFARRADRGPGARNLPDG